MGVKMVGGGTWLGSTEGFVVIIAYWVLRISVLNWGWLILYLHRTLMGGDEVGGVRDGGGVWWVVKVGDYLFLRWCWWRRGRLVWGGVMGVYTGFGV